MISRVVNSAIWSAVAGGAMLMNLGGCGREENAVPVAAADSEASSGGAQRPSGNQPMLVSGFARLEAATEGIPTNPLVGNAARLEKARAWVELHGGDRSPREREMQAQFISMLESMLNNEVKLDRFGAIMEFQVLELWSKDADGDGTLSVSEAGGSQSAFAEMFDESLIYFGDQFDADGDGTISSDETNAAGSVFESSMMPVFGMIIDRVQAVAWDTNADGSLSEKEIGVGNAELGLDDEDLGLIETSDEERYTMYGSLTDGFAESWEFIERGDHSKVYESFEESLIELPNRLDYDFDGDGDLSDVENRAFLDEQASFVKADEERERRLQAEIVRSDYDVAVQEMDVDGDDLISDAEWTAGFGKLRRARDARVFLYLYDGDDDGEYSEADVTQFMNAYDTGSIFADADLNGTVDVRDLVVYRDRVLGQ